MKNILLFLLIFMTQLNGMDVKKEYVNSVINYIFKTESSSSVLYTAMLKSENPTVRWELRKDKKTNQISCQEIHTHEKDELPYDTSLEDLPLEYFDLIEQKYLQQEQSKQIKNY